MNSLFMRFIALSLCLFTLSGCPSPGAVGSLGTEQDIDTIPEKEQDLWALSEELHETLKKQNILLQDTELTNYLQNVLIRIFPEFKDTIQVFVVDAPDANAFAIPNGYLYFNTGLLARMDNEAQFAIVAAHEGRHFTERHSYKQQINAHNAALFGAVLGSAVGSADLYVLSALTSITGYSVKSEQEADTLGFEDFVNAGYRLSEAPKPFEILAGEAKALNYNDRSFFRTHPKMQLRVENLQSMIEQTPECVEPCEFGTDFLARTQNARIRAIQDLHKRHNYRSLIYVLDDAQKSNNYPSFVNFYLADALRLRGDEGDIERAVALYQNTINTAPEFAPTYRELGRHYKLSEPELAANYFKRYLELRPNAPDRAFIEQFIQGLTS